jgi:hypothetical protein
MFIIEIPFITKTHKKKYLKTSNFFNFPVLLLMSQYIVETKPGSHPASINNEKQQDNFEASLCEEQIEHVPQGTASPGKALFMLLKAFIGTGVIFLPGS